MMQFPIGKFKGRLFEWDNVKLEDDYLSLDFILYDENTEDVEEDPDVLNEFSDELEKFIILSLEREFGDVEGG